MCDPVSLGALALSAAGTVIGAREQNANMHRVIDARNNATMAEMARQRGFQAESAGQFDTTLSRFAPQTQAQALADAVQSRRDTYAAAQAAAPNYAPVAGSAPAVIKEIGRKTDQGGRAAAADARRFAPIGARGDVFFGNDVALNTGRQALATTGNLARGSAALLPGELRAAEMNAYRPPGALGQTLRLAGQLGGLAGAAGGWDWLKQLGSDGVGLAMMRANPTFGWRPY